MNFKITTFLFVILFSFSSFGMTRDGAIDSGGTGAFGYSCQLSVEVLDNDTTIDATSSAGFMNSRQIAVLKILDFHENECPEMKTKKSLLVDISEASGNIIDGNYVKYPVGSKIKLKVSVKGDPINGVLSRVEIMEYLSL